MDLVIAGGLVFDGSGGPPAQVDVGVDRGRIVRLGDLSDVSAGERRDARDLAVAPGFIDAHTHSDMSPFFGSDDAHLVAGDVRQGVTTEVCGNCGFSPFPRVERHSGSFLAHMEALFGPSHVPWSDFAGFSEAAEQAGLYSNLAPLVGHGSLRAAAMGFDDRPATREELATMRRLLDEALSQGATGLSSGLVYAPGRYAGTDELVELGKVAARHGRPYTTHMRGETDMVAASIEEAVGVARASGASLQISHHKTAGRANWGRTRETLELIERAADEIDVTMDVYPYTAAGTLLYSLLPPWAQEGGIEPMLERLAGGRDRARIRRDMGTGLPGWENLGEAAGWDAIVVSSCRAAPETEGRSVSQLASRSGSDPVEFVLDLLVEARGEATMIMHLLSQEDVDRVIAHPLAMIGSDGIPLHGKPHPRWAGSFARVLGDYGRERGLLDMATAIHKMTAMPARRFGLSERGAIAIDRIADLVIFDPERVGDRASFEHPLRPPVGIDEVFVGGVSVVRDGQLMGSKPGCVIRAG
jgi:N-acyl-D-amino-acid deacylase